VPTDDERPSNPQPWPPQRPRRALTGWQGVGLALAIALGVCGLAVLAFGVLFVVGMNQWASNK